MSQNKGRNLILNGGFSQRKKQKRVVSLLRREDQKERQGKNSFSVREGKRIIVGEMV